MVQIYPLLPFNFYLKYQYFQNPHFWAILDHFHILLFVNLFIQAF